MPYSSDTDIYVDTDWSSGGRDGSSSDPWNSISELQTNDADSIDDGVTVTVHCAGTFADPGIWDITGWAVTGTGRLVVEGDDGGWRGDGFNNDSTSEWDANYFTIRNTAAGATIDIQQGGVTLKHFQVEQAYSASSSHATINISGITGGGEGGEIRLEGMRLRMTGGGNKYLFACGDADAVYGIYDCLLNGISSSNRALIVSSGPTCKVYNCGLNDAASGSGISLNGGTMTCKNTWVSDTSDDFNIISGTFTADYLASDDDDDGGANSVALSGTRGDDFVDHAGGDFNVVASGALDDNGIGPSSDSDVPSTDPWGNTRSGTTCHIGWVETSLAAPAGPPAGSLQMMGVGV